jgi:hypothetical protein
MSSQEIRRWNLSKLESLLYIFPRRVRTMDVEYQYLAGKLEDALATDPRVNALDVKVRIRGDKIHLTGEIPTEERREAATKVVMELAPGIEVLNELTVFELNPTTTPEAIHA